MECKTEHTALYSTEGTTITLRLGVCGVRVGKG